MCTTLKKSAAALFGVLYETRTYRIYRKNVGAADDENALSEDFEYRVVRPEDQSAIRQIEDVAEWLAGSVKRKITEGALCVAAFEGDSLAGFNLVAFGEVHIPLLNMDRRFRKNQAWSEHIAVLKAFRKRGLAVDLRRKVIRELKQRKVRWLYGGTLVTNEPALRLTRKAGFKEIVDIVYRKVLFRKLWLYKRIPR